MLYHLRLLPGWSCGFGTIRGCDRVAIKKINNPVLSCDKSLWLTGKNKDNILAGTHQNLALLFSLIENEYPGLGYPSGNHRREERHNMNTGLIITMPGKQTPA
jgi:hypothetical protein